MTPAEHTLDAAEERRTARVRSLLRLPLHVAAAGAWFACVARADMPGVGWAAALTAMALFVLETAAMQFPARTAAPSQRIAFGIAVALSLLLLAVPAHEWLQPWREGDSVMSGFGGPPRLRDFALLDAAIAFVLGAAAAWLVPARVTRWLQPSWTLLTIGAWALASA